jgi:methyl-accepting chemotaxis protein
MVAEIAQASKEQSNGIDQVNIAISEMDKVVQQNAANAEESASAAEEMNAQAEQLKEYVNELVVLVTGGKNETTGSAKPKIADFIKIS